MSAQTQYSVERYEGYTVIPPPRNEASRSLC